MSNTIRAPDQLDIVYAHQEHCQVEKQTYDTLSKNNDEGKINKCVKSHTAINWQI